MAFPGRKKRPVRSVLTALLSIVVYFLLFPYPLGRERVAVPRWAVAIPSADGPVADSSAAGRSAASGPTLASFQLGSRFGYVQADGFVPFTGTVRYRVALSSRGFVNFTRLGTDWIVRDPSGRHLSSFSGSGYPLLSPDGGRIFTVKSDLSGLEERDGAGEPLWNRDFPTLMTCLSVQGDLLLVGLLDGTVHLLNRQGSPVFEYAPGGSRIPVVVGCAVSPDGSRIAAVSGIDPQFLTVLSRQAGGYSPVEKMALPQSFRRELRVGFSPDSRLLFVEGRGSAGLVDAAGGRLRWVALPGTLAGALFSGSGREAAFVSRDGATARLVIQPFAGTAVCREEFPGAGAFRGEHRRRAPAGPRRRAPAHRRGDAVRRRGVLACSGGILPACAAALLVLLPWHGSALDWPVANRIITGTFGEDRGDHFHNGIDIGGGSQDVHAVLPGELVFRYDESTDYSSLPRGLGTFVVLRHEQDLLTLYAHLQSGSLDVQRDAYQPADRLGVIGKTGDADGPHLHFGVFDEETGSTVNPLEFLPPVGARQPPVIRRVFAQAGDRRVPLDNGVALAPGRTRILAEAYELREDVAFSWPMAPASVSVSLDGAQVSRISFDGLQVAQGHSVLSGSSLPHDTVYDSSGLLVCASLDLKAGDSRLTVTARNYAGLETSKTITISVRQQ